MDWHGQKCLLSELNLEADFLIQDDIKNVTNMAIEPSPDWFFEPFFLYQIIQVFMAIFNPLITLKTSKNKFVKN